MHPVGHIGLPFLVVLLWMHVRLQLFASGGVDMDGDGGG